MGRPKITQEEFEKRIKKRFPTEQFTIIKYDSLGKEGIFQCEKCKQQIKVNKANNFLAPTKAYGCVNCHGLWKTREEKLKLIKEKYYIVKTSVKGTHTLYTIKCKQCGHIRETCGLTNIIKHLECGCVTGVKRNRTPEEFIQEVNENSVSGSYELLSDYIDQTTKVKLRHSCGFIWDVRPGDVIHAHSQCPRCGAFESKGVRKIKQYLTQYGVPFMQEVKLENSLQRFDFFIEELNLAIEYNGKQHYEEIKFFSNTLEETQNRDRKKAQYCKDNNIELIVIPYIYSYNQIQQVIEKIKNKFNDYLDNKSSN